ncbi:MAG: hypothetical protein ACJ762_19945 [Solirubrobacteraceae bacterium]
MPRLVRRASPMLVALGVAVLVAGCGGGASDRDAVRAYIADANAVQQDGSGDVTAANAAYRRFARGKKLGTTAVTALQETPDRLRSTRDRLAGLEAPEKAAGLRRRLLAVFDRDIELADEAALLAAYIPAATNAMSGLPRASRALRRGLGDSAGPEDQEQALGAFVRRLERLEGAMRRLSPPKVLLPSHRSQLLKLDTAGRLAERLKRAVAAADAARVASLLLRFRDVYEESGVDLQVQRAAVRAYRARLGAVNDAVADLTREQQRLQRSLG